MDIALHEHRLMVLMFTDLVNSSGCKIAMGDAAYAAKVARPHNEIFRHILASTPGSREVNYTGDGFFALFERVSDAAEAALRFHAALRGYPWETGPVETRIGIHVGEAILIEGAEHSRELSLVSHAADMCARVMSLGAGGQTLLTRHAFDDARQYVREHPPLADGAPTPALGWAAHGRYRFKGKDEDPLEVFEVGAVGLAPLTAPPDAEKARRVVDSDEEETLGWRPGAGVEIPGKPDWLTDEKLGEGGFGEVWLVRHRKTGQRRVFKFCFDPDRLRTLKRELTIFRLIRESLGDRDDIARLHDVRLDRAPFYLEGDYVESGDLAHWAEAQGGMERVPMSERLALLAGICRAVAAAHSVGVIHKDIKPSNIFIRRDDAGRARPVLADFGIGVVSDPSQLEKLNITATGLTMTLGGNDSSRTGTRMYAPPESMLGKAATVQSDVFALGVLLYQFAIGDLHRPLATGWERDVPDATLREDIAAATAGKREDRLKSVNDLLARLEAVPARQRTARRRRIVRQTALAAAVLLLVAGVAALIVKSTRGDRVQVLTTQLQQQVDTFAPSAESLAEADRLVAELAPHSPQNAAEFHQRFTDRFSASVERAIYRPNLTERDGAGIETMLGQLQPRDAARAEKLRRELSLRLRQWTQVYALTPPFNQAADLPAQPTPGDTGSMQLPSAPLPLPVSLGASARVDAEIVSPGGSAALAFQTASGSSYEFRAIGPEAGSKATKITFDPASAQIRERMNGWYTVNPDAVSLVLEDGEPVLRLENQNPERRWTSLLKRFDAARHRGKLWKVTFRYRAVGLAAHNKPDLRAVFPRFVVAGERGGQIDPTARQAVEVKQDCDWTKAALELELPAHADRIILVLTQACITGRFEIADLRIFESDNHDWLGGGQWGRERIECLDRRAARSQIGGVSSRPCTALGF
jgi:serine/threonine protein kinase/class 3 adenylate cyclase